MAVAFFLTSAIVQLWSSATAADAGDIRITEATYGKNCEHYQPPPGNANQVRDGNATGSVAAACARATASCQYAVDVAKLGDPASGCGKDFLVNWRCGTGRTIRQAYLPAEGQGSVALIACRKW